VSRFFLTRYASQDLDEIRFYLAPVPERHAAPIRRHLRSLLHEIAAYPERGAIHSQATRIFGEEIRTRALPPYRIFYRDHNDSPEVVAILHMARDAQRILMERVQ
jgi:plasmid stabilization system protein ParE